MATSAQCLLCQIGSTLVALPLTHVIEVMRPLPLRSIAGAPSWMLGVSVQRGIVTPVLDAALLLQGESEAPAAEARHGEPRGARWIALRVEARRVAIAVDGVLAAQTLPETSAGLPPLLSSNPLLEAVGSLDRQLFMVLKTASLVSHSALLEMGLHGAGD
jgi:chemotaxis signal transduction protein